MAIYDAFISYSHAEDSRIAEALQSVTQILGKPWYRRRLLRVFRDDASLPATAKLWPDIAKALDDSRYLILLASPDAARSSWVARELMYWLDHKNTDSLLIGLTAGEIHWDSRSGDFDWSKTNALPSNLVGRLPSEPRWIDLRHFRDGRNLYDTEFKKRAADFAAAVLAIPKEDLLSRELQQQRRVRLIASSAAGVLLLLAGLLVWQWNSAVEADRRSPQAQVAAFKNFLRNRLTSGVPEAERKRLLENIDIVGIEDLNGDSLLDFIIFGQGTSFCGSGGCTMEVYLAEGGNSYRKVLDLFGHSTPRVRANSNNGFREITATYYRVERTPVWSVFRWDPEEQEYTRSHYLYCGVLAPEHCRESDADDDDPSSTTAVIDSGPEVGATYDVGRNSPIRAEPEETARTLEGRIQMVIGKLKGRDWFLVQIQKEAAGFVRGIEVKKQSQ